MAHGPATRADGWVKYISRWVFTTNHKDIGTLYLWFSFAMFILGGAFAMIIRAELFQPGMQLIQPEFFNQMTTMHGLVMVFGAIMPAFVGLANWLIPMMIGAPIIIGISQLAKPTKAGIIAPNTITKPCIVVIWLKNSG